MKLLELRISGFAKLTAVEIRPDGALVPICGANNQGKSSVLKAIWSLVLGSAAAPAVAINTNSESCTLFGDFGEFRVTRTITRDEDGKENWTLKVVDAAGTRVTMKPQAVINGWLSALTFDPLEFARLDAKKQFDKLKVLVPDFDFDATARARKEAFDQRTDVTRQAVQAEAAANAVQLPPGGKPPAPPDVSDLLARIEKSRAIMRDARAEDERRHAEVIAIDSMRDQAENLRAQAAKMERDADARETALNALAPLETVVENIEALQQEITGADAIRQTIALFDQRQGHRQRAEEAKATSAKLTAQIDEFDARKAAAIAKAKLPVKGLSFGDDEILMNGIPFTDASTMQKIMAGAALAMAMDPKLKVMTIDEGSELDSTALNELRKMAEKYGFSVWFTKVDESGETGFVIHDGVLAS